MSKGVLGNLFSKSSSEPASNEVEGRIVQLEQKLGLLEEQLKNVTAKLDKLEKTDLVTPKMITKNFEEKNHSEMDEEKIMLNSSKKSEKPTTTLTQLYMPTPTPDGYFNDASSVEITGKSIYLLTTRDCINGSFIMLDTPDSIATAMISVSQFVKPICKISGHANIYPSHIITEEEGHAVNENGIWRVVKKAIVRFEN